MQADKGAKGLGDSQAPVSEIAAMRNLGKATEAWLNAVGIYTRNQLRDLGAVNAYHLLRAMGYPVTLNLAYGIEASLLGIDWRDLPCQTRADLKLSCAIAPG